MVVIARGEGRVSRAGFVLGREGGMEEGRGEGNVLMAMMRGRLWIPDVWADTPEMAWK